METNGRRCSMAFSKSITVIICCFAIFSCCSFPESAPKSDPGAVSFVARAAEFRTHLQREKYELARALMVENPKRWWGSLAGPGLPWRIGERSKGSWAEWDKHFRSEKTIVEWREGPDFARAIIREMNDYYRLLNRGSVTNEVTYFFDDAGMIEGLLIRAVGQRPRGLTDEFLEWARVNDPVELEELMPGGEIDPSGDHPRRFRRLLNRWRRASGLEVIE